MLHFFYRLEGRAFFAAISFDRWAAGAHFIYTLRRGLCAGAAGVVLLGREIDRVTPLMEEKYDEMEEICRKAAALKR